MQLRFQKHSVGNLGAVAAGIGSVTCICRADTAGWVSKTSGSNGAGRVCPKGAYDCQCWVQLNDACDALSQGDPHNWRLVSDDGIFFFVVSNQGELLHLDSIEVVGLFVGEFDHLC